MSKLIDTLKFKFIKSLIGIETVDFLEGDSKNLKFKFIKSLIGIETLKLERANEMNINSNSSNP